jgi:soluble cytochrome b562
MNNKLKGKVFGSDTTGIKGDDGYWKLTVVICEKETEDGATWREEKLSSMAFDTSFQAAHETALRSVLQEMNERVYAKGFDSLIEAIDSEKRQNGELPANDNKNPTS